MQQRKRWRLLVLLLVAPAASGWNDTGHMVAALIAYDRMPSSVSAAMGRLLHSHPRLQEDFVPRLPKALRNAAAAEQHCNRDRPCQGSRSTHDDWCSA